MVQDCVSMHTLLVDVDVDGQLRVTGKSMGT